MTVTAPDGWNDHVPADGLGDMGGLVADGVADLLERDAGFPRCRLSIRPGRTDDLGMLRLRSYPDLPRPIITDA
jgi:hypothetical protein